MILIDANILIYAHSASFPQHGAARDWLDARLTDRERVALPWPSLLAFTRTLSNPRAVAKPESLESLWAQIEAWLSVDSTWIPSPAERHPQILKGLLPHVSRPELVQDAHLAALAIGHGLTLCSTDGDFARFPGLRWENPLR